MTKTLKIGGWVVLGVGALAALACLYGFLIQALWNWLMRGIFGLPPLTLWQALGLFVLATLLFGSGSFRHQGGRRKESFRAEVRDRLGSKPVPPQEPPAGRDRS